MLRQKIQDDMKSAMKAQEKDRLLALRNIWNAIRNKEIDAKHDLSDDEIIGILNTLAKQRRDSIDQFRAGKREDLVAKEEKELSILQGYLPQQLSKEELAAIIKEAIAEASAAGLANAGLVMKAVMPKVKGRADGKLVSQLVNESLPKP